ncbi:MAG TPA: TonB family protein [Nitrospinota bacterium]|nr:TonB family protein [Nitrospinota bacterium]
MRKKIKKEKIRGGVEGSGKRRTTVRKYIVTKKNIEKKRGKLDSNIQKKASKREFSKKGDKLLDKIESKTKVKSSITSGNNLEEPKNQKRSYTLLFFKSRDIFLRLIHCFKDFIDSHYKRAKEYLRDRGRESKKRVIYGNLLWENLEVSSYKSRLDIFLVVSFLLHLIIFLPFFNKALETKEILKKPVSIKIVEVPEVSEIKKVKEAEPKSKAVKKVEKKVKPKKTVLAKKTLSKPEQKQEPKKILQPKKEETQKTFNKPKLLASSVAGFKEDQKKYKEPFKFLKTKDDIERKRETTEKIPDLFKGQETLKRPKTTNNYPDLKNKTPDLKPKILISQGDEFEKKFKAPPKPFFLTHKFDFELKEEMSHERILKTTPKEFKGKEAFIEPTELIASSTKTFPTRLVSSQPIEHKDTNAPKRVTSDMRKLAFDKSPIKSQVETKGRSKEVENRLEGREIFRVPEDPEAMARAPVDLRKKVEHPLLRKDAEAVYVSLDSDDPQFKDYLEKIKRRIMSVWHYPVEARPGLKGRVSLEFRIEIDGSVSSVYLLSSSGYIPLDKGAVNAIHKASPFPPVPSSLLVGNKRRLAIDGHFKYN